MPLVNRTRAALRIAELGFLGVVVYTRRQIPRLAGHPCKAGEEVFARFPARPKRINWFIVGIASCGHPGIRASGHPRDHPISYDRARIQQNSEL